VSVVKSRFYFGANIVYSSSPGQGELAPRGSVVILKII
jgi:hypothetical protein